MEATAAATQAALKTSTERQALRARSEAAEEVIKNDVMNQKVDQALKKQAAASQRGVQEDGKGSSQEPQKRNYTSTGKVETSEMEEGPSAGATFGHIDIRV